MVDSSVSSFGALTSASSSLLSGIRRLTRLVTATFHMLDIAQLPLNINVTMLLGDDVAIIDLGLPWFDALRENSFNIF